MRKLTIEVTDQQHKHIKAMAAIEGLSMKEFVIDRVMPTTDQEDNWPNPLPETEEEFYDLIRARIKDAHENGDCGQTIDEIYAEAIAEADAEQ